MRRAFLRAVWGECWGRKAVDGVQVTGGLPSNGMPAGAFRPAHGSCRRGGSRSLPAYYSMQKMGKVSQYVDLLFFIE